MVYFLLLFLEITNRVINTLAVLTCREVLFSEKGELKKALMVSKTTFMMYFSRMGSVRRFSRLLQTCTIGERR